MSDKPTVRVGSHWKRPPTKVYDYNYDVGQHYYQPMIRHLDKKSAGVSSDSPGPMSFAERLAEDPLYGRSKPAKYVSVNSIHSNMKIFHFLARLSIRILLNFDTVLPTSHRLILGLEEEMVRLPGGHPPHLEIRIKTISLTTVSCISLRDKQY